MSIIFVLIPLAVIIVCLAVGIFFWAVKNNQFDDLERQGYSILFDDDIKPNTKNVVPKKTLNKNATDESPSRSDEIVKEDDKSANHSDSASKHG